MLCMKKREEICSWFIWCIDTWSFTKLEKSTQDLFEELLSKLWDEEKNALALSWEYYGWIGALRIEVRSIHVKLFLLKCSNEAWKSWTSSWHDKRQKFHQAAHLSNPTCWFPCASSMWSLTNPTSFAYEYKTLFESSSSLSFTTISLSSLLSPCSLCISLSFYFSSHIIISLAVIPSCVETSFLTYYYIPL